MKKAELRISRPVYGNEREAIEITVSCKHSRLEVITLELSLEDFTKVITSQNVTADVQSIISEENFNLVGKKREVLRVGIDKPDPWGWKPTREQVVVELASLGYLNEWSLWDDGLGTQQNDRGKHNVILCKYVDVEGVN